MDSGGPKKALLDGSQIPRCEVAIFRGKDMSCAKIAEPIDLRSGCGLGWAGGSTSSLYSPGGANVAS